MTTIRLVLSLFYGLGKLWIVDGITFRSERVFVKDGPEETNDRKTDYLKLSRTNTEPSRG